MKAKSLILICVMFFSSVSLFAQNSTTGTSEVDSYGVFSLGYSNLKSANGAEGTTERGFYGWNVDAFRNKKLGFSAGMLMNHGIMDWEWASMLIRFGTNYSYFLSKNVTIYAPLRAVVVNSNYQDFEDIKHDSYSDKWDWGADLTPTLAFRLGRIQIGAGVNFLWMKDADKIETNFEASIGICPGKK